MQGLLVASTTRGRYAVGDGSVGPDLTSGLRIEIKLGDRWILGHVERSRGIYVGENTGMGVTIDGYYFAAEDGTICGLRVGMEVRTL